MATQDQLIKNLIRSIERATDSFNESLPGIQKEVFGKIVELSRELEVANGRIKATVENVRLIGKIKKELERIIVNKPYLKKLDSFIAAFDTVQDINARYFSLVNKDFKIGPVFKEIKKQIIQDTINGLTESGIGENITEGIREILRTNITSGARMSDMVEQMRKYITDTRSGDGALVKYAKQITTDSINQYNAHYTQLATQDLGFEWFQYVGSLIQTSREFCVKMIEAGDSCAPFIHKSQFKDLVNGKLCNGQVRLYKKTNLPYGMIEGTTADNLFINRGGYNCGHQFYPVSSVLVPKSLREKYE